MNLQMIKLALCHGSVILYRLIYRPKSWPTKSIICHLSKQCEVVTKGCEISNGMSDCVRLALSGCVTSFPN